MVAVLPLAVPPVLQEGAQGPKPCWRLPAPIPYPCWMAAGASVLQGCATVCDNQTGAVCAMLRFWAVPLGAPGSSASLRIIAKPGAASCCWQAGLGPPLPISVLISFYLWKPSLETVYS